MTGFKSKKAAAQDKMAHLTLEQRCRISEQCLPDAPYRAMLIALHDEMLAALAQPEQRPWVELTDESITQVIDLMPNGINGWMSDWDLYEFAGAVLAKSKERNI